jgi:hypothetical protein
MVEVNKPLTVSVAVAPLVEDVFPESQTKNKLKVFFLSPVVV